MVMVMVMVVAMVGPTVGPATNPDFQATQQSITLKRVLNMIVLNRFLVGHRLGLTGHPTGSGLWFSKIVNQMHQYIVSMDSTCV